VTGPLPTAETFTREYGCTTTEWQRWMGETTGEQATRSHGAGHLQVDLGAGHLDLHWHELPPRRIALISLARLEVRFAFTQVPLEARLQFLKAFDRHLQRGGG
jgi:hypothetical protein